MVVSVDKIGIGTTNAQSVLDVVGDINIVGVLTATTFGNINAGLLTATSITATSLNASGVVTATSYVGSGASLTGIPQYWGNTDAGIHTTASVGIGTTNPTTELTVVGLVSATTFAGNITGTAATFASITGDLTGDVTGTSSLATLATNAQGLTGSPNITVGDIVGTSAVVGSAVTIGESGLNITGVVTATSFVGDGSSLTGVANTGQILAGDITVGVAATIGIVSFSSSGIVTTTDSVGVVTYHGDVSNAAHQRWYLGANGSTDYTFVGSGMTFTRHDPTLYVARGSVVEFVNNMGAHPFQIQLEYQNTGGTAYNDGVTNNNSSSGTIRFEVPHDAPNTLYYQCTSHSGMAGTITVHPSI